MTKSQPYFTVDELAERWEMTRDGVLSLGAEGLLTFGVFLSGILPVEVGSFECAPGSKLPEFQVESSLPCRGFIPVTPGTVAAIWLNGAISRIDIPNTDCGKVVIARLQDYIPFDENDEGGRLLVDLAEVERYEGKEAAPSGTPDDNQPPRFAPKIGWQIALLDAWPELCKLYGGRSPTAAEAIRYLRNNDKSGAILNNPDSAALWWKTQEGRRKDVALKTVQNLISVWKQRGVLPT